MLKIQKFFESRGGDKVPAFERDWRGDNKHIGQVVIILLKNDAGYV